MSDRVTRLRVHRVRPGQWATTLVVDDCVLHAALHRTWTTAYQQALDVARTQQAGRGGKS